ncbi:hypothetical protein HGM15179_002091 [Zosterops borbonicus]|uniref:Uncharacterized protein n=1 Tax=Zosterops borbonicus TaxID=364589 RepID=A0A8K1GWR4_9PASS|nr:hypothetical protein HGM15179_002091 [Zosterops borbonicus]
MVAQQKNLEGYVGFANLPNQVYRKSVKRGFEFTLMVVGIEIRYLKLFSSDIEDDLVYFLFVIPENALHAIGKVCQRGL